MTTPRNDSGCSGPTLRCDHVPHDPQFRYETRTDCVTVAHRSDLHEQPARVPTNGATFLL
jgi:hypothetical protein